MKIAGLEPLTLQDYPGEIAAVIFTAGCNLRCPYCHNPELVKTDSDLFSESDLNSGPDLKSESDLNPDHDLNPDSDPNPGSGLNSESDFCQETNLFSEDEILEFLKDRQQYLDAVVISGGEPLIQSDLVDFAIQVKELGYKIRIDSNGTCPRVLQQLLNHELLDMVAWDYKLPRQRYQELTPKSQQTLNRDPRLNQDPTLNRDPTMNRDPKMNQNPTLNQNQEQIPDCNKKTGSIAGSQNCNRDEKNGTRDRQETSKNENNSSGDNQDNSRNEKNSSKDEPGSIRYRESRNLQQEDQGQEMAKKISRTGELLSRSEIPLEIRTTAVPGLVTADDISKIAREIAEHNYSQNLTYVIQGFRNQRVLDPGFAQITPYSLDKLQEFKELAEKHLDDVTIRKNI